MKKETKIRKDFHGNRDFYNLIKGIASDIGIDSNDNEKVRKIIKYIERNFGGIDYEIDIDFNSTLDYKKEEIKSIKEILQAGVDNFKENTKLKIKSVYLFKALYNLQCDKNGQNSQLKINPDIIKNYNLNNCINDNIKDNNSRYLLLEVSQTLTTLIYQNIRLQNQHIIKDDIKLHDGSTFDDDNNKEYNF